MNKLKLGLGMLLIGLITILSFSTKTSAYSDYVSLRNPETILFSNDHYTTMTEVIDVDEQSMVFGNLSFDYTYRLVNDEYYLLIYRYEYFANGEWYNETLDESIEISGDLFDLIDVFSVDSTYINNMKTVLNNSILYVTITLEDNGGYLYPIINIHDEEFYYTNYEFELDPFINVTDDISFVYLFDYELELVHTTMLYETYLYNRYRNDGNSLSQIEDISITDWLTSSISGFIDTPLLGGVSIGDILMIILSIGLLFLFLRFFAGG